MAIPQTDSARKSALAAAVAQAVREGGYVETQADFNAIIRYPGKRGMGTGWHVLLTILTSGLWIIAWVLIARRRKPAAISLYVDEGGRVQREALRSYKG